MINPVGNNLDILENPLIVQQNKPERSNGVSFSELLKNSINKVNDLQINADQTTTDFALGRIDNIHEVTIAAEEAQLALNLTMAIQNKIVDAYKEIMRMQV